MPNRKQMKTSARQQVKKHYVVLTVLCAISVFFGTEFTGLVSSAQIYYDALTGQITEPDIGLIAETYSSTDNKVLDDLIDDNLNAGRDSAAEKLEELRDSTDPRTAPSSLHPISENRPLPPSAAGFACRFFRFR